MAASLVALAIGVHIEPYSELPGVETMRKTPASVPNVSGTPSFTALAACALDVRRFAVLAQIFLRPAVARPDLVDPVAVENVHVEPDAALLGQPEPFVVDQRGMFDGPSTGLDRGLDALGAMSVGDAIFAERPGLAAGGFHHVRGQLEHAGLAADGQDRAGGDQLDEISAAADHRFDAGSRLLRRPSLADARNSGPTTTPGLAPVTAPPPPGMVT